ncbi:MAG: response regulator [Chitinispirillia bacterium]|nr:response regulator [Chitinispirillia bacterium]MCL2242432.1 response regulator [Chitinispirillia bacterium]
MTEQMIITAVLALLTGVIVFVVWVYVKNMKASAVKRGKTTFAMIKVADDGAKDGAEAADAAAVADVNAGGKRYAPSEPAAANEAAAGTSRYATPARAAVNDAAAGGSGYSAPARTAVNEAAAGSDGRTAAAPIAVNGTRAGGWYGAQAYTAAGEADTDTDAGEELGDDDMERSVVDPVPFPEEEAYAADTVAVPVNAPDADESYGLGELDELEASVGDLPDEDDVSGHEEKSEDDSEYDEDEDEDEGNSGGKVRPLFGAMPSLRRRLPETVRMMERHVLLAEDVQVNRELIAAFFEGSGVKFKFAANGQEACELFEANPNAYSMILMDIQMPVMDGHDAAIRIRENESEWAKQIPIIAMTAADQKDDLDRSFDAGMDDHVTKPVDMDALQNKIFEYIMNTGED